MGVSNDKGTIDQPSAEESIMRMAASLAGAKGTSGYYKNAKTLEDVARIYAPPGAKNDPKGLNRHWATGVGRFYGNLERALGYGTT